MTITTKIRDTDGHTRSWVVDGRKEPVEHTGPLSGSILDVLAEPHGAFWLCGSDGLAHYTPPTWRTPPEVSSVNEPIGKMLQDRQGRLWFVSVRHLLELDGSTWTIRPLPSNIRDSTAQSSAFCMLPDERLAIQTQESEAFDRLLIFDIRRGAFQKVTHPGGRSISGFSCRNNGGLWVTTAPGLQLEIFDGRNFQSVADLSKEWQAGTLRQILERGPDLIIGANGGVGIVHQGHFQPFGPADGFTESGAFSLTDTGHEIIAAGRQDLLSYDGNRWKKLASGLMPRFARRMRDGTLWVASFTGVHQFRSAAWITNGEADGLPSDHVRNIFEDNQDRIWAGTNDGLSLYHRDADTGAPRSALARAHNAQEVPPDGHVRIHLIGVDQWKRTRPEDLLFAYRLDDGPWHPFAAADTAEFDEIPAGPHHLQVRTMDRSGNAETGGELWNFVVLSPWYRNPSFILLSIGASFCILSLLWLAAFNYRKLGRLVVQLDRSRIAAEHANRCKTEFMANMSHEIRTPMNAIMGMSQLAMETPSGIEQREYLGNVTAASESLLGLLNDVLDLSKIEAGKLELSAVDFSLPDCLDGLVRTLSLRATEKGLAFTSQIHPDIPEFLHGDDQRLRQVLINLAGNALKFTSQGSVTIEVHMIPEVPTGKSRTTVPQPPLGLHFVVRDTGRGVDPERQAAIFRAFEQEGDSTSRTYGGTGLGLTISARIVEMMHGHIGVESPWSDPATDAFVSGSAFHFEAWFAPCQSPPATDPAPDLLPLLGEAKDFGPLRILLAEDNPVNQLLAVRRLSRDGHQVMVAFNGEEAVDIFQRGALDLILMDIQMPKMTGFQATAAIRERERSVGGHIPIIALTAHALEGFRQEALDAGMDEFVTKPIRFDELRAAMRTVLAVRPAHL